MDVVPSNLPTVRPVDSTFRGLNVRVSLMEIPGYQIIKSLGQGAFGAVYLAVRADGRKVAVKALLKPSHDNLARFEREWRSLQRERDNRNVVDVLDFKFDGRPAFIVMEYCAGGSLRSWVGARREWPRVASALYQAANGLKRIHERGGFHRDIKPDNLLVAFQEDGSEIVKVGDFGLARDPVSATSSAPMTRAAGGTAGYMAPELALGAAYSTACDVYSLGVTGIELCVGSIDVRSFGERQDLPHEFRGLLLRMVSPDPAQRPTVGDVRTVLINLMGPPVAAAAPPTWPQRTATTNDGAAVGTLALAAGVTLLTAAVLTMNSKDANGRFRGRDGRYRSGRWG